MSAGWVVLLTCGGLLAWGWFGYPLLMLVLARLLPRRRTPPPPVPLPTVTVVVATRESRSAVSERVTNLLESDYPPALLNVVVCVDASVGAPLRAELGTLAGARVTVIDGDPGGGKASSVNAGVRSATGEVLVFTDTQQRFEPGAVMALVAALAADPRVTVVGGALYLPGDRPGARRSPVEWYWAAERALRSAEARLHSTIGVSGSIYAMWRRAWVPMRTGLILDDVFVPMQQVMDGHRVAYTLHARAWDARRTDAAGEKVRKVRTLTGNFQLVAWLPALLLPVRNPVWFQLVNHKLLRLASPWLAAGAAVSGAAVLAASASPAMLQAGFYSVAAGLGACLLPPVRRRVMPLVSWVISLNAALVKASLNGLRGQWDVW
ncbi:MAG: glycosyltransferase [Gemmatimonadaceae bacterium]|nr:glycosyltransferase [Gemmatimonadaceae bacterium]